MMVVAVVVQPGRAATAPAVDMVRVRGVSVMRLQMVCMVRGHGVGVGNAVAPQLTDWQRLPGCHHGLETLGRGRRRPSFLALSRPIPYVAATAGRVDRRHSRWRPISAPTPRLAS